MSLQEEEELRLIEDNITFNEEVGRWNAKYPWIKDPGILSDNRLVVMATLRSTENRLRRNTENAKLYDKQIQDMVQRGTARILESQELNRTRIQCSICFIMLSSILTRNQLLVGYFLTARQISKGCSLNDCLAKGPSIK